MASDEQHDEGLDPALRRVLTEAYLVGMDVEVAARHLWRLREESERIAAAGGPPPAPLPRARRRVAALLSAIFLLSMSGVAVAGSGGALPGELLYPVKRGTERVQLLASRGPTAEAELSLRFARLRLSEATTVGSTRPSWTPRLLAEAVHAVDRAERLGGATVAREAAAVRHEAGEALVALASSSPAVSGELTVLAERLAASGAVAPVAPAPPTVSPEGAAPTDAGSSASETGERERTLPPRPPASRGDDVPPPREVARVDDPGAGEDQSSADDVDDDHAHDDGAHDGRAHGDAAPEEPRRTPPPTPSGPPSSSAPGGTSGSAGAGGSAPPGGGSAGGGEAGGKHMPTTSQLAARFDARDSGGEPPPET